MPHDESQHQNKLSKHKFVTNTLALRTMAETEMKALRLQPPGTPQALKYEGAPRPQPGLGEVLIRVVATAITAMMCLAVFDTIGEEVKNFKVGDHVFALTSFSRDGSAAEYVDALPSELVPKPKGLTHEQAAAVPLSALTAWQALFVHAELKAGQKVLIAGAAGGVGVMAVQLAKWADAYVIGICSGRNVDFVKAPGAEEPLAFEEAVDAVAVILDFAGDSTPRRSRSLLKDGGALVSVAEPPGEQANDLIVNAVFFVVEPNGEQLGQIVTLIGEGRVKPIVDSVLPLSKGVKAFEQVAKGHSRGKIVFRISK
ncbi:MAG: hypothetical protein M1830_006245 [Pleopsidium flavum]|nr:MAG: hypothetical protein M1830_006245 [Pleopsidium flavum]